MFAIRKVHKKLVIYTMSIRFVYVFVVLDFEPNNITAKEFYPLIEERMRCKYEIRMNFYASTVPNC